jgi:hypothetical protein
MNENLLHYIWKHRLFTSPVLKSVSGENILVLKAGEHNHDAGPDFFNARIKIDYTEWAGNVELHLKTSDWEKHRHQNDKRYHNIILHVVYEHDKNSEQNCPVVELKPYISEELIHRYRQLILPQHRIPCADHLTHINALTLRHWMDRVLTERLQHKCEPIELLLAKTRNNFEETFYIWLMRALGLKVNADAFEQLATMLPLKILAKHKSNLLQLEALLLGCAGMLPTKSKDDYARQLQAEFNFLQHKYLLNTLPVERWKWLRLRPGNFPELRLAQMASLIHQSSHLLSRLLETEKVDDALLFFKVQASAYWNNHYRLGVESETTASKKLGTTTARLLLINAVIPFLFMYGERKHEPHIKEKALMWLEHLPAEQNSTLQEWAKLGINAQNAGDSQALLTLQKEYCNFTRCLECSIGHKILNSNA